MAESDLLGRRKCSCDNLSADKQPVMAPLYSRYVPPKPTPALAAPPVKVVFGAVPQASPDAEHKRKRERSEEEKNERKAKKLRKKADNVNETNGAASPVTEDAAPEPVAAVADHEDIAGVSEFAHVMNVKKRHKLEKEARRARKQATKAAEAIGESLPSVATAKAPSTSESVREELVETSGLVAQDHEPTSDGPPKREKGQKRRERHALPAGNVPATLVETTANRSTADDTLEPDPHNGETAETAKPAAIQSKKRRHKLEAILQQTDTHAADAGAEDNDDDEHLRNYGSIMSKFQKSREKAEKREKEAPAEAAPVPEPVVEKRDLVPFPQPVNEPQVFKPPFSALPSWLSAPSTISNDSKATFADLKLPAPLVQRLIKLGFVDALPVQQALLPLLLPPGTSGSALSLALESALPDVAVSAATGSGKTIAYLLPMIEALKQAASSLDRLRAVIVMPTRELVSQVTTVAESLTKGSGLKVGTASGTGKFKDEQQRLVKTGKRYDPAAYRALMAKAHRRDYPPPVDSEDFEDFVEEMESWNDRLEQEIQDAVGGLVDHIPTYSFAVDVLVCTPGRLLEHLNGTLGFNLSFVEWLILDEADKLLDQQYDGLLQRLDEELSRPRTAEEQDARERLLRSKGVWDERFERRLRKVVLSATMTRDISKLTALKLRRPKMIVVQGGEEDEAIAGADTLVAPASEIGVFELPQKLKEYCVPAGDGAEKPLHLLELLSTKILANTAAKTSRDKPARVDEDDDNSSDTDSSSDSSEDPGSDSTSEFSSSDSSDSSNPASSSDSDGESSVSSSDDSSSESQPVPTQVTASKPAKPIASTAPTILIFTSSAESATRLSHLLSNLRPDWSSFITSLTKTSSHNPKNTKPTDPVITIATDRAGRGLDALSGRAITHVLQYDVPRSLTAYVHRVGRTARASRGGEAWTLYSEKEARWFVNEIMRAGNVRRAGPVERVRVGAGGEEMSERFAEVLGGMREVVFGASQ